LHLLILISESLLDDEHPLLLAGELLDHYLAAGQLQVSLSTDLVVFITKALAKEKEGDLGEWGPYVQDTGTSDITRRRVGHHLHKI